MGADVPFELSKAQTIGPTYLQVAYINRAHPQSAEELLAGSGIFGARFIAWSGEREIVMLAVPVNDYQPSARDEKVF
jgi:hypothetical protein